MVKKQPLAKAGVLDLREWDFETDGTIDLDGEWAFFWENFIETDAKSLLAKPDKFVKVPSFWNGEIIKEKTIGGSGYASYKLTILMNPAQSELSIKLLSFGTAYELYANGKKIAQNGTIGKSTNESQPYNLPLVQTLVSNQEKIELVLQVSNFNQYQGGFWQSIRLGKTSFIQIQRDRLVAVDLLLAGCLLIMAVYHFGMYLLRSKDISALYFALFSILFGIRTLITDEKYLLHLFPDLSWFLTFRLEFLTVYLSIPIYMFFLQSVYPQEISKKITRIIAFIFLPLSLFVVFSPTTFFSATLLYARLAIALVGMYVAFSLIRTVLKHRDGSGIFFLGFLVFFGTVVNDLMFQAGIVPTNFFSSYGMLIFIFTQSFVLSIRYAKAITNVETLSATLEQKVEDRTAEISQQKDEIEKQHQIIEKKNQNITASITYASRIQQAILGSTEAITSNFKESFILLKPKDIVSGDFYWYTEVKKASSNVSGAEHKTLFFKVIAAADCTGHGIPGAFMTVMGNALLDEIINENRVTNPSKILSLLDRKLLMKLQKHNVNDGMDMSMLIFDEENQKVSFSGANNPLYYVRDGDIHQVKGSKFPVGSSQYKDKKKFDLINIDYQAGDIFYIFSDGFQDQFGGTENRKYYTKQFRDFLLKISSLSLKEQKIQLEEELEAWKGNYPQTDDILVIGIKV